MGGSNQLNKQHAVVLDDTRHFLVVDGSELRFEEDLNELFFVRFQDAIRKRELKSARSRVDVELEG